MDLIDKNKMINTTLNKLVKEYSRANLDITQHIPRMIFEVNLVLKILISFFLVNQKMTFWPNSFF